LVDLGVTQMKNKRSKKHIQRLRAEEEKYEEAQIEEKRRIQKDKIISEEEDEEKEEEEENGYIEGRDEEKDYKYGEKKQQT
jgi:hypothetical protein